MSKQRSSLVQEHATVVVVGNTFNVRIFQQHWLIENEIFNEEHFGGDDDLFTPLAVNIGTDRFRFLVVPERIQAQLYTDFDQGEDFFGRVVGRILELLPHSPVTALGLNFDFLAGGDMDAQELADHARRLFMPESSPLASYFATSDSRFGGYYSKNLENFGCRARLNIQPVSSNDGERLRLNFNMHYDVSNTSEARKALERWSDVQGEVRSLADKIAKDL